MRFLSSYHELAFIGKIWQNKYSLCQKTAHTPFSADPCTVPFTLFLHYY